MSAKKRSAVMARIKGKDTGPERAVAAALAEHGLTWESHARDLPGRPDFVFRTQRIAIFVDGDFWHGWHFPHWRSKLSEEWEAKIDLNRRRDAKNHRSLRQMGWKVIRLWEHQVTKNVRVSVAKVLRALETLAPDASTVRPRRNERSKKKL